MLERRLVLILCLLLPACAHAPTWTPVVGKQAVDAGGFEVDLPQGWMSHHPPEDSPLVTNEGLLLLITRDGAGLQVIRVNRRAVGTDYPGTKKKLSQDMLPQELAELVFDRVKSNQDFTKQQIIESSPTKIADLPGFRLAYGYQDKTGVRRQSVRYGFLVTGWYYQLTYDAPVRYYFPKDLPVFERVKESFRLLKTPPAPPSQAGAS